MPTNQLEKIITDMQEKLGDSPDIILRRFKVAGKIDAALFFIEGLVDKQIMAENVLEPLITADPHDAKDIDRLEKSVITTGNAKRENDIDKVAIAILAGIIAIFVNGSKEAILVDIIKWERKGISEPQTDVVVRGPREGFTETLRINMALLRRKVHHHDLNFEVKKIGRYSNTDIAIVYINSIVNKDVLEEVRQRLSKIDIDAVLESGYIEQLIEDHPYSIFPTIGNTEKPDVFAAKILEGRVGILVDGTPIGLTIPMLFIESFQSPEDAYSRFYYVTKNRLVRYTAFFVSCLLPALFVAVTDYHKQFIPSKLLHTMTAGQEDTPFSTGISVLVMILTYELLREAGVRLPRPIGQTVSIVGAIVMGDAAVSAGLISAPVLIVVAAAVIASFVTVPLIGADSYLRLYFILAGWTLGGFGLVVAVLIVMLYLSSMRTFGVPYLSPMAPLNFRELGDSFIRLPLWALIRRPQVLSLNRRRMSNTIKDQNIKKGALKKDEDP
ncbi:MAG: spore germination protein [Bacillota bacterium]|jgi:spore germination protein KA